MIGHEECPEKECSFWGIPYESSTSLDDIVNAPFQCCLWSDLDEKCRRDPRFADDPEAEDWFEPYDDGFISWLVEARSTGHWNQASVEWQVYHEDGALCEVTSELLKGDEVVDSQASSVRGESAGGKHILRTRGEADAVRLTVTDIAGISTSEIQPIMFEAS